jgi:sulfonate transport system permease protein
MAIATTRDAAAPLQAPPTPGVGAVGAGSADLVDPTHIGPGRARAGRRGLLPFEVPRPIQRLLGPALLLLAWQLATQLELVDRRTLPRPEEVWDRAWEMIQSGELQEHAVASLGRIGHGLVIGVVVGLVLAVVAGLSRVGENLVDGNMEILRAVPNFALLPLFIVWMGIGEQPKVVLISITVAIAIYVNTYSAIRDVDAGLVEAARTFGVGRWGLIRYVMLPGALPGFMVGLRWALSGMWLALIFAETVNAPKGLGRLMSDAREFFQLDTMFVVDIVYAVLGLASLAAVRFLEARLLVWRRAFDGD